MSQLRFRVRGPWPFWLMSKRMPFALVARKTALRWSLKASSMIATASSLPMFSSRNIVRGRLSSARRSAWGDAWPSSMCSPTVQKKPK